MKKKTKLVAQYLSGIISESNYSRNINLALGIEKPSIPALIEQIDELKASIVENPNDKEMFWQKWNDIASFYREITNPDKKQGQISI